jgi:hypothetical protein
MAVCAFDLACSAPTQIRHVNADGASDATSSLVECTLAHNSSCFSDVLR